MRAPDGEEDSATGAVAVLTRWLATVNRLAVLVSTLALVLAAGVLTYSVLTRYFFKTATDWRLSALFSLQRDS